MTRAEYLKLFWFVFAYFVFILLVANVFGINTGHYMHDDFNNF